MRWNSALGAGALDPHAMPGYFASNALATRSATGRSIEVYQTTLPSFLAASISAGVIALGGRRLRPHRRGEHGQRQRARALEHVAPETVLSSLPSPPIASVLLGSCRTADRSSHQRPAALRRQVQPDRAPCGDALRRRRYHAQLRAVGDLDHIVAAAAEEDLPHHRAGTTFSPAVGGFADKPDVVLADRDGGFAARRQAWRRCSAAARRRTRCGRRRASCPCTMLLEPMKRATNSERGRS